MADEIGFQMIELVFVSEIKRCEKLPHFDIYTKFFKILSAEGVLFALPVSVLASGEFPHPR